MVINMHKDHFKKKYIIYFLIISGCANHKSIEFNYTQKNIYDVLTNNAIDLYGKRNTLLTKKKIDYYKCYDKIIYGKTFLDKITFGKEIACHNNEWQPKVAYNNSIPIQIDFFSRGNVYRQSIFLNNKMQYMGRYYAFNKSFTYYLYDVNNNYYDYFSCNDKKLCNISRIYKDEDALLHPTSESNESYLLRKVALEKRKNRYRLISKRFLEKYESIPKNIIKFKQHDKEIIIDKKNKTYVTISNGLIRVFCRLSSGECFVGALGKIGGSRDVK